MMQWNRPSRAAHAQSAIRLLAATLVACALPCAACSDEPAASDDASASAGQRQPAGWQAGWLADRLAKLAG